MQGRGLVGGGACVWEAAAAPSSQGPRDPGAACPAELPGLGGLQAGERLEPGLGVDVSTFSFRTVWGGVSCAFSISPSLCPSAATPHRPVQCSALGVSMGAMHNLPDGGVRAHLSTSEEGAKLAGLEKMGGAAPPFLLPYPHPRRVG